MRFLAMQKADKHLTCRKCDALYQTCGSKNVIDKHKFNMKKNEFTWFMTRIATDF